MGEQYATCKNGECRTLEFEYKDPETGEVEFYKGCANEHCTEEEDHKCGCFVILYEAIFADKSKKGDPRDRNDLEAFQPYVPPRPGQKPSGLSQSAINKRQKDAPDNVSIAAICKCCKLRDGRPYKF